MIMLTQKISFVILTSCLFASLLPGTHAYADPEQQAPEAQALVLQNNYKSLTSLIFDFDQVTRTGTRERPGEGHAMFYRYHPPTEENAKNETPALQSVMRWDYTEPDPQIIVSDGETLSIYTEKDKQLIRTPAKELEADITYAFFAGTRNLLDDFVAETPKTMFEFSTDRELQTLLLVPRQPHNQIRDVQMWFDGEGIIHHLRIRDHFDSVTELNFENILVNSLPPGDKEKMETIITFPIPPGTEIISR